MPPSPLFSRADILKTAFFRGRERKKGRAKMILKNSIPGRWRRRNEKKCELHYKPPRFVGRRRSTRFFGIKNANVCSISRKTGPFSTRHTNFKPLTEKKIHVFTDDVHYSAKKAKTNPVCVAHTGGTCLDGAGINYFPLPPALPRHLLDPHFFGRRSVPLPVVCQPPLFSLFLLLNAQSARDETAVTK